MTTQTFGIQEEIEQAITRRKIAAARRQEEEAQRQRLHQENLIALMRNDLGAILDSLDGAEIIYIAYPDDDYAKAAITVTVDSTRYTCYVTHAQGWSQFGVSNDRHDIDHYVGLNDLRDEILLTLIQQIEFVRAEQNKQAQAWTRASDPADLPF